MGNRILLADDSITIQKVVNLTFADEGIEVVSVSNGDMAERRLNEVNPDLVLADIFMPGKNGYELCESIKQSPQFGNVPVVLLVGAFEPFDQAEARRVRADAHLTKPFESRTLVETVRKLINTSGNTRTGSLSPAPAAEQPGERPAEGRASGSAVQSSTRPDSPAMKNEAAPPTPQRVESPAHSPAPSASENAPMAQYQPEAAQAESIQPLEVQFAPETYQEQPDLSSGLPWMEQTELLTSVSATDERPSDPLDVTPLELSAQEPDDSAAMASVGEIDTPDLLQGIDNVDLDLEALESGMPSGFGIDDEEMVLDLDRPEAAYTHEADDALLGDRGSSRAFNFDSTGSHGESTQASSWTDSDVFKTQMLEPPEGMAQPHMEERIDTNPLEMPLASDFHRPSTAPLGLAEMHEETSSSTLLAVDDPLGDVLMDEQEMDVLSYDPRRSSEILFTEQPAIEEFNLEFNPQEQEVFDVPEQPLTPVRTTGALIETAASTSEEPTFTTDPMEQRAEPYALHEDAAVEAQPQLSIEPAEAQSAFEPFTEAASEPIESDGKTDWSESGFEFSSEFQTATPEQSSDHGEYTFDSSNERLGEDRAPLAEFTTSAMWNEPEANEPEARFAPIDIEATPVDESEAARGVSERDTIETGFEIAPAMDEGPSHSDDAQVPESSSGAGPVPREAVAETADVPAALIDEIVRRVISQMSESVVREIAWEVVPDVVERVIKEMARDEVSKRV
jgi:CheY-like chemotaxis protein